MKSRVAGEFPPLYYARLGRLKPRVVKLAGCIWLFVLGATAKYFSHPVGAGALIPVLWSLALYVSWSCLAAWGDAKNSRVVPYFRKHESRVRCTAFLTGKALARVAKP